MGAKAMQAGLLYAAGASGKSYISMWYHRGTGNPHKACWAASFPADEEHALFERCDAEPWSDESGNFWGIVDGGSRELGTRGQRFSFCPYNASPSDPWHGYPVSAVDPSYEVPEEIVDKWTTTGEITKIVAKRIRGGKL